MREKLIKLSFVMYGVSVTIMADTIAQTISQLILAGVGAVVAWAFVTFVQWLKKIYDHIIKQDAINEGFKVDIARIEKESKEQYDDLSAQVGKVNEKLDLFMKEIRRHKL